MILQEFLELGQFVFVVAFSVILFHCINYPVLFRYAFLKLLYCVSLFACNKEKVFSLEILELLKTFVIF